MTRRKKNAATRKSPLERKKTRQPPRACATADETKRAHSSALRRCAAHQSRRPNLEVEAIKIPSALRSPSRNRPEPDKEYSAAPLDLLWQRCRASTLLPLTSLVHRSV